MLSPDFKKLKRTIFEGSENGEDEINKGETILRYLNIHVNAKIRPQNFLSNQQLTFIRDMFHTGTTLDTCLNDPLDYLMSDEYVLISETINRFLPCFNKESFTLKKSYKVVDAVDPEKSWGKFAGSLGNVFYIDKTYLLSDMIDMAHHKLNEVYEEHLHQQEYVSATEKLIALLHERTKFLDIDNFAI